MFLKSQRNLIDIYARRDTVCSVGLIPKRLPFVSSNTAIRYFRHAVSLDERRAKFKANLYNRATKEEAALGVQPGEMPEPQAQTAAELVDITASLAKETVAEAGLQWSQVVHTVVGTPGVLEPSSGRFVLAPNVSSLETQGVIERFRQALGPDLTIENDANLAALGERVFGCGKEVETFVFLTIGTGLGMGIISHGTLYRGAHGASGEVAYLPLGQASAHFTEVESGTEQRAMLEDAVSAKGIVRAAQALGLPEPLSARSIFDAARAGNALAATVIENEARLLAQAIAAIAAVLDPAMVVLGGGIGQNFDLLGERIERQLHALTPLRPQLVPSQLGQDVVLLGAIATGLGVANDLVFQQRTGGPTNVLS